MPLVERIGLADSRIPIAVLVLWALVGLVSHLPALATLNLAKVLLCIHHLTVLVVVPSIAIAMLVPIVVVVAIMVVAITPTMTVSIATMMIMPMIMSSIPIIGSTLLLLWS